MTSPPSERPDDDLPADGPPADDLPDASFADDVPEADAHEQAQTLAGQTLPADRLATAEADEGDLAEQARDVPLADRDEYP